MERVERIERNESKIMLPTPPVRHSALATIMATKVTASNQSENNTNENDTNKSDANNVGDGLDDSHKNENDEKSSEPNEVNKTKISHTYSAVVKKQKEKERNNLDNKVIFSRLCVYNCFTIMFNFDELVPS